MLIGIVRVKAFALILGSAGFGIASQLINLNLFVGSLATLGLPLGLIKVISESENENKWDVINNVLKKSFIIFLILGLTINLFILLFAKQISSFLYNTDEYYSYIIVVSFSVPFLVLISFFDSVLRGLKKIGLYTKISIFNSIIVTVVGISLVYMFSTFGIAVNFTAVSILGVILYLVFFKLKNVLNFKDIIKSNSRGLINIKDVFNIGIASLLMTVFEMLTMMFLRSNVIKIFGLSANGIYQGVYGISSSYLSIFLMIISVYSLPVIAGLKESKLINSEVNLHLRFMVILLIPTILLIFVFRDIFIVMFFSREFLEASNLFYFNLIGDLFKIMASVFSLWLIAKSKVKLMVLFNIAYNAAFLLFFFLYVNILNYGLESITIAYFLASMILMLLHFIYIMIGNSFRLTKQNIILISTALLMIFLLFSISLYNKYLGYGLFFVFVLVWFFVSIKKDEFIKVIGIIREKIKSISYFN